MTLYTVLIIIVVLLLLGAIPRWNYSRSWGYGPSGALAVVVLLLVILAVLGRT